MEKEPFSIKEIIDAPFIEMDEPEYFKSNDNVELAYYSFLAISKPFCSLIFIHGGGAYSGAGYQHLANGLKSKYNINVYLIDLRGHGKSKGERGGTPATQQIWKDIKLFVDYIRKNNPQIPLVLGGHSSGGGLVLNYSSWKYKSPVDAYIFISPKFGYKSRTDRYQINKDPFAKIRILTLLINILSFKLLFGNKIAVRFNYSAENIKNNPLLVTSNSCNMTWAITPLTPQKQFKNLDRPFCLISGKDDELLDSDKIIKYADFPDENIKKHSFNTIIENSNHLSVLLAVDRFIGDYLLKLNYTF